MTVGIDDGKFMLLDNWPGPIIPGPNPASWVTPSTTEDFKVGTKRAVYSDTNHGWSTLMFLKYEKGTAAAVAVKGVCTPDTTESIAAGGYYIVTNDGGEGINHGPIAIALATMADGEYGWFWVGGVCPVNLVSGLDGIFPTDGTVTAGSAMKVVDLNSYNKFEIATGSESIIVSAFAFANDTTS